MFNSFKSALRTHQRPVTAALNSLGNQFTAPRGFHAVTARLADQKLSIQPVKAEWGASSLFEDVAARVEETPVAQGGKAAPKEYQFSTATFKTSTKKLRLLANQIKGLDIQNAINQMEFSEKRPSKRVMNTLAFARTNASTQAKYGMDPSKLYVDRAWVGKGDYHRRIKVHARGKYGVMHHPAAHLKFTLKERQPEAEGTTRRKIRGWKVTKKVWTPLVENKPIYNPSHLYNW
ncbi:hypothetical protein BGW38_010306 [Lunasporangiospora selenospora]|uniref:50S ribosomal protein L22 n=1 Tax=Lunasporangiospora selenospora TaxID=979761 RepID=A0A9P6G2V5_9FUNG|nr:hypothetical protein BGW38_010306 [Lunasporangiospora selenospora]